MANLNSVPEEKHDRKKKKPKWAKNRRVSHLYQRGTESKNERSHRALKRRDLEAVEIRENCPRPCALGRHRKGEARLLHNGLPQNLRPPRLISAKRMPQRRAAPQREKERGPEKGRCAENILARGKTVLNRNPPGGNRKKGA